MNRINLLPDRIKVDIYHAKKNKTLLSMFFSIVFLVLIFGVFAFISFSYLNNNTIVLDKSIQATDYDIKEYGDIEEEINTLNSRISDFKKINDEMLLWSKAMDVIKASTPSNLYLMSIISEGDIEGRGSIIGNSSDKVAIASFIRTLEKSDVFEYIDIDSVSVTADSFSPIPREANNFTLSFSVKKGELR